MPGRRILIVVSLVFFLVASYEIVKRGSPISRRDISQYGLSPHVMDLLERGDSIVLYSLDPRDGATRQHEGLPPVKNGFHGYEILGQVAITNQKQRQQLVDSLYRGILRPDAWVAACFLPRHGIRASRKDDTVELLICFECARIETYESGNRIGGAKTNESAASLFNETLRNAGQKLSEW